MKLPTQEKNKQKPRIKKNPEHSTIGYRIKKLRNKRKKEEDIKLRKQISKQIRILHNKKIRFSSKKIDTLTKGYLFFRYTNDRVFFFTGTKQ